MLSSTQRGLGAEHRRRRLHLLATTPDGELCWRCGRPMFPQSYPRSVDLDHLVDRSQGGVGGPSALSHSRCNRAAGGRLSRQMAAAAAAARRRASVERRW